MYQFSAGDFLYYILGGTCALTARTFGEVVVTAILIHTPIEVTVSSMCLVVLIMALYDTEVVARINEVLLPVIILPVLAISVLAFQKMDILNILPIIPVHPLQTVMGIMPAFTTFLGYEVMMIFYAHVKPAQGIRRAAYWGIGVTIIVYILIVLAGILCFGYEENQQLAWATLELVKSTQVPGFVLERVEAVFIGVWVAAVFTTAANTFFTTCVTIRETFGLQSHKILAVFLIVVIYFVAMRAANVETVFQYLNYVGYMGILNSFLLPMLLWGIAKIRKLGNDPKQQKTQNKKEETLLET